MLGWLCVFENSIPTWLHTWYTFCIRFSVLRVSSSDCMYARFGCVCSHMATYLDLLSVFAVLSCMYRPLTARALGLAVYSRTQYPHVANHLNLLPVFDFLSCMLHVRLDWLCAFPHGCAFVSTFCIRCSELHVPSFDCMYAWLGCVYAPHGYTFGSPFFLCSLF